MNLLAHSHPAAAPVAITGSACLSALGHDLPSHLDALTTGVTRFRPLAALLGNNSPHAAVPAAWIEPRSLLTSRKWSPLAMAALHVAREATAAAAWSPAAMACCRSNCSAGVARRADQHGATARTRASNRV